MPDRSWRQRLGDAVKRDGRSLRSISLAAGLKENTTWELLNTDKAPGIDKILALAPVLGVTVSWLLEGIEISPESARLLKAWGKMSKDEREAFLQFVEHRRPR